jgi:hypothetical protein
MYLIDHINIFNYLFIIHLLQILIQRNIFSRTTLDSIPPGRSLNSGGTCLLCVSLCNKALWVALLVGDYFPLRDIGPHGIIFITLM